MGKKIRKRLLVFAGIFCLGLVIVGCGTANSPDSKNKASEQQNHSAGNSGNLTIVGSTSVQPLAQELADAYMAKNKAIKIDVQGVGSTAGVKAIYDGTCDIGISSRELKAEEKAWQLTEHPIAIDGIGIVVHAKNPVADLTKEQITKIFKGEIKNWKEVGGQDKEILVVSREAGSGSRGAFDEMLKLEEKKENKTVSYLKADALIAEGNGSVKANVVSKDNAIAYLSIGFIDNTLKAVKVNGVEANTENIKIGKYSISRPFLMLTKSSENENVKNFLAFIKGDEGQAIVTKNYIPTK